MKIEELMNTHYQAFNDNDRYICACILNHKKECGQSSIETFANTYHLSTSTLSRFAQKLGLPGYSELKSMIRFEQQPTTFHTVHEEQLLHSCDKVIDDMEHKDCTALFQHMKQGKRIILFGDGYAQGRVAKEMKRIFLPTGMKLYDMHGVDMLDALLSFVKTDDMVFFISLHGESNLVNEFAKQLKMKGIYLVSITKMISNTLSHICDENLYIQSTNILVDEKVQYEITTPYFMLIELLYVKYKLHLES